jgi:threonine efflux protein
MNASGDLWVFAGVMILGQFSPGPDMVLLTRSALKYGVLAGVKMALGIGCGLAVHATLAVAGLALTLERLPKLQGVLRWAAACYLIWLAYGLVRGMVSSRNAEAKVDDRTAQRKDPFLRGLFCNLLNPKAAIFLTAVCAPFLKGDHPTWWPLAIWTIIVGQGFVLWSLWAWLLQWRPLRQRYDSAARWIDGAFGIVLLGLAIRLVAG